MAGNATLRYSGVSNDNYGFEVFDCALTNPTTSVKITPTLLKSIDMVSFTPGDATAATADKGYISSFVPGAPTVDVVCTTASTFFVKIEGKVA